jgi:hypothetical protein
MKAMPNQLVTPQPLILYQTEDSRTKLEVCLQSDSIWLSHAQMARLFDTTIANINIHIKNILEKDEYCEAIV